MYYCLDCGQLFREPVERPDIVDLSRIEYVCPNCASIEIVEEDWPSQKN